MKRAWAWKNCRAVKVARTFRRAVARLSDALPIRRGKRRAVEAVAEKVTAQRSVPTTLMHNLSAKLLRVARRSSRHATLQSYRVSLPRLLPTTGPAQNVRRTPYAHGRR